MCGSGPDHARGPAGASALTVKTWGRCERQTRSGSFEERVSGQADSLERPLALRALRIARPPAVAIRARKPCFLERRRLFGWNVRFTTRTFRSPHRRRQMNLSKIGASEPPAGHTDFVR